MADNNIALDIQVKGVEQSIESVKDLKNAIKSAKDEQIKMAAAFGESSKEYLDATKKVSGLKDKVDDLNDSTKSLKGTGVEQLTQGFAQMKDGIMNLDFEKVKGGIAAMKSGMGAFASSAKTALQGVKGALIATGIGALVVALGLIVAYWDDIKGAITGVTEEQKKLNAASKENLEAENNKLKALNSSDNILKSQGLTEKQILELKSKQTAEIIKAAEAQLQMTIQTQLAEKAAAERSKGILNSLINFISLPLTALLKGIDGIGAALGQNFGLMEGFQKSITDLLLGSDAEMEEKNKKEIADQVNTLRELKNNKAGYNNSINKIDADAAKTASENAKKKEEEDKKARDEKLAAEIAAMKQIQDAYVLNEQDEQKRAVKKSILDQQRRVEEINKTVTDETLKAELLKASETTFQNEMAAIYQTKLDKDKAANEKAAADRKIVVDAENAEKMAAAELAVLKDQTDQAALLAQLQVKREIALQDATLTASQKLVIEQQYANDVDAINKASNDKKKSDEKSAVNGSLQLATESLAATQQLTDLFFDYKKKGLQKGSKEEIKAAENQFKVNKALQIANAVVSGIQGVMAAYSSGSAIPIIGAVAGPAFAILAGISAAANIAKIASAKFNPGTTSAPSSVGDTGGAAPAIPAPPTISTPENNTNKTTSFDETGKNLNAPTTVTPTIKVTATVGVDEISAKKDRVDVLENQSTFK
jgi:hypothetical protein